MTEILQEVAENNQAQASKRFACDKLENSVECGRHSDYMESGIGRVFMALAVVDQKGD